MNYQDTLEYLYNSAPMFQQVGSSAYKEGLQNTMALDEHFGHPHRNYRTIHVGGTNGKGSCSHTIAAILQNVGYKVGLYTSPHLVDFRERIRINGEMIPEEYVVKFVDEEKHFFEPLQPSFFELTTAMAFKYFAEMNVDIALIEVGLGGRLDCTNIITPDLCIITNISLDHTQLLGDSTEKIAREKAGIIKRGVPIVIGEANIETKSVFVEKSQEMDAPIIFAEETIDDNYPNLVFELKGLYQSNNRRTIITAIEQLIKSGYNISEENIREGFANVCKLTGLMGRWQILHHSPTLICDTGHNVGAISYIVEQLRLLPCKKLHIVIGMVNDKDICGVLSMLPQNAEYYFTKASVKRALPEQELAKLAFQVGLHGSCYTDVVTAVKAAQKNCLPQDAIFVGGSSFIVADLLAGSDALYFH